MPSIEKSENDICRGTLSGKTIVVGVTSSIAAYKAAYLVSALVQKGASIHVVMTENAKKMVGESTFWSLTKNPVISGLFDSPTIPDVKHVSLANNADMLIIAPATANIIGKIAHGIADDFLSTMALAARCPIVICPAMNENM